MKQSKKTLKYFAKSSKIQKLQGFVKIKIKGGTIVDDLDTMIVDDLDTM